MGHAGEDGRRHPTATERVIEGAKKWLDVHPRGRLALMTIYYLAIIAALLAMYGRGNFETPEFVYQEF